MSLSDQEKQLVDTWKLTRSVFLDALKLEYENVLSQVKINQLLFQNESYYILYSSKIKLDCTSILVAVLLDIPESKGSQRPWLRFHWLHWVNLLRKGLKGCSFETSQSSQEAGPHSRNLSPARIEMFPGLWTGRKSQSCVSEDKILLSIPPRGSCPSSTRGLGNLQ